MLSLLIALAIAPVQETQTTDIVPLLKAQIETVDASYAELSAFLLTKFAGDTERATTGMTVVSMPEPGADGLHEASVVMVFRKGPAQDAGINPGDRILFIGARRIEHEPTAVIASLINGDGTPKSVQLTLRNGDADRTVTINRRPLDCMKVAAQAMDTAHWIEHIANIREIGLARMRSELAEHPGDRAVLATIARQVVELAELLPEVTGVIGAKLNEMTNQYCEARFE